MKKAIKKTSVASQSFDEFFDTKQFSYPTLEAQIKYIMGKFYLVDDKQAFIARIFELDPKVLIPILEEHVFDLFFQLSGNKNQATNNFFARQFFALPHHHLEHIFAAHENGFNPYKILKTSLFTILTNVDFDILEQNILQSREPFSGEGPAFNKFKLALEVFSNLIGNNGPIEQL